MIVTESLSFSVSDRIHQGIGDTAVIKEGFGMTRITKQGVGGMACFVIKLP